MLKMNRLATLAAALTIVASAAILPQLAQSQPDNARNFYRLGASLQGMGQHQKALEAFENDPAFQEALHYEARLHLARGGKIIKTEVAEPPHVEMTQEERDAADAEDDVFMESLGAGR